MTDAQTRVEETCDWLLANPKELDTPDHFLDTRWLRSKVVSIGERHDDTYHRELVAKKVRRWGGPHVGLALEIGPEHQDAIDRYLDGKGNLPGAWFARQPMFKSILDAAAATDTPVVAMDAPLKQRISLKAEPGGSTLGRRNRNAHMAKSVLDLVNSKTRVLVLSGMEHAREGNWSKRSRPSMGAVLSQKLGASCYTIHTMTKQGHSSDPFYKTFKAKLGNKGAGIAFDVDRSPLAKAILEDAAGSMSWGNYCDGLVVYF